MPHYNFNNPSDRLACCLDQPDSARRSAIYEIVKKHHGWKAAEEMKAAWNEIVNGRVA